MERDPIGSLFVSFPIEHIHRQLTTPLRIVFWFPVTWDCVDPASDGFHPVPIGAPALPKPLMWCEFNPTRTDNLKIVWRESCHAGVFDAFTDLSSCPIPNIHKNTGAEQSGAIALPLSSVFSMAYPRKRYLPVVLGICQVMKQWQSFCRVDREGISRNRLRRFAPKTCCH